jgi:CD109 antigen
VWDDSYALAIAALAFARNDHSSTSAALDRLLELAISDGNGIHWEPHSVETTAYAILALIEVDRPQANEAIKWLSLQRNSLGGFGHTQDTVMGLRALMTAARAQARDVDLSITVTTAGGTAVAEFSVNSGNFDVLQIAELPGAGSYELAASGSGECRWQLVRRFNVMVPDDPVQNNMAIEVTYDASNVQVNDIVNVNVTVRYFGQAGPSGMMIVDVGVPTGFAPQTDSLVLLLDAGSVSRYEVAGRKVILYVDGLTAGEERDFSFQVKALMPVRAIIPDSKAYLYYRPDIQAEAAGGQITVELAVEVEGDLNGDGGVDLLDFARLAAEWPAGGNWPALALIADNWLSGL